MTKYTAVTDFQRKKELPSITPMPEKETVAISNKTVKKGLTTVRLEDCFRCDACSCIYLEESDYLKHIKNFHGRHDRPNRKRRTRRKKSCQSCCTNCKCRNSHEHQTLHKQLAENSALHICIKDRWSKLMEGRRLKEGCPEIKTEPPDDEVLDYSHLLSQVEVRIKTEPTECPSQS